MPNALETLSQAHRRTADGQCMFFAHCALVPPEERSPAWAVFDWTSGLREFAGMADALDYAAGIERAAAGAARVGRV